MAITSSDQFNLLNVIFDRMPMGIALIDREYRIQRFNPTWAEFSSKYAPPSSVPLAPGVSFFDHIPGSESVTLPRFEKVLNGETIRQQELCLELENGVTYWDIVMAPLMDGDTVIGIVNTSVDVTEQVSLRQSLEEKIQARTVELERRQSISESLRDIIGMVNSSVPLDEFLQRAVEMAAKRLGAGGAVLHRFDLERKEMQRVASYGVGGIYEGKSTVPFSDLEQVGALTYLQVTLERQPTYTNFPPYPERVDEIRREPSIPEEAKKQRMALRAKYACSFSVPLFIQERVYGGMVFYYTENQEFSDEQIQLGMTFAEQVAIAIENAYLHEQEQVRQHELEILLKITSKANSSLDLKETLASTIELLVKLVHASRAGIIIKDEITGKLGERVMRPQRKVTEEGMAELLGACERVASSGEALYVEIDPSQGFLEPGALLPVFVRNAVIAVLVIIGAEGDPFTSQQLELFNSIARQLGTAIENARLYDKAEQAAIATERNRLARDLHDAVSQTLFSASLIADVLPKLWDRNPDLGKEKLDELRTLTRGALSEMRTLLLELRPASLVEMELGDLLRHLSNAFTGRTRIPTSLTLDGQADVPTAVKEVFYRVGQETLNNIGKHAQAESVSLHLQFGNDDIRLIIEDDGVGIDLSSITPESLGLGIMRERSESIGAELDISSQIGKGTRVTLTWKDEQDD